MRWCWSIGYVVCDFSIVFGGYFLLVGWLRRYNVYLLIVLSFGNL